MGLWLDTCFLIGVPGRACAERSDADIHTKGEGYREQIGQSHTRERPRLRSSRASIHISLNFVSNPVFWAKSAAPRRRIPDSGRDELFIEAILDYEFGFSLSARRE